MIDIEYESELVFYMTIFSLNQFEDIKIIMEVNEKGQK